MLPAPPRIHEIPCRNGAPAWRHLRSLLFGGAGPDFPCGEGHSRQPPELLVGAGHATHLPMLAARRACGGKIVVLMRPSLPLRLFDLCVIPEHDRPPQRRSVIATEGALNACPQASGAGRDPNRGLIVLGGPSRHYGWSDDRMLAMLESVLEQDRQLSWELCDSRRTPAAMVAHLEALGRREGCRHVAYRQLAQGWLPKRMGEVGQIWVSEDSVSMISEALSSGAAVGLLPVSALRRDRVHRQIQDWLRRKRIGHFRDWQAGRGLPRLERPLREADRVASLLLERGLLPSCAMD